MSSTPADSSPCEGCDGRGIRCPASPDCQPLLPPNYVCVERCDSCEQYANDLAAGRAIDPQALRVLCDNDGTHIAVPRDAADRWAAAGPVAVNKRCRRGANQSPVVVVVVENGVVTDAYGPPASRLIVLDLDAATGCGDGADDAVAEQLRDGWTEPVVEPIVAMPAAWRTALGLNSERRP